YAPKLHQRPPAERYARCRTIGQALAEALGALHEHNLIHRDVKPSNVLIDSRNRVVLADFGVVKDQEDGERTSIGQMIGTRAYAAPEQIRCERIDPRADLFGLGATLYYTLTLRRPFEGISRESDEPPPPPSRYDPNLPSELEAVVMRLLSLDPRRRYADAREVARALSLGEPSGMPLAGRQHLLEQVRDCLDRAQRGETLLVRPVGPPGTSRDWLADTLLHGARRRGIPIWRPGDGEVALRGFRYGVIGLLSPDADAPDGIPVVELETAALGIADVRRSLVATAPLTNNPAAAAEALHRMTGGLPALLIPLLSQYTEGSRFTLPEEMSEPAAVSDFFDDLDIDELDTLAALAAFGRPAEADLLESVTMIPADTALEAPMRKGIVQLIHGRWRFVAELFAHAAMARAPDPEGLEARAEAALESLEPIERTDLETILGHVSERSAAGALAEALGQARSAVERAVGRGDRAMECRARSALGQALLDVGLVDEAARSLADATALAKASGLEAERRLSHVLRARATLEGRPGRRSAAAAIDRLLPLVTGAGSRLPDRYDVLIFSTWARAAGVLGDRRAFERAQARAEERLADTPPQERLRATLALAQGAAALGQRAQALSRLAALEAGASAAGYALLSWEGGRLRAALEGGEPPPTSPLAYGLEPQALSALKRRAVFVSGRLQT
ncbi:MAG: serine/threonine-protein kinase, partial [Myxococcota bacterium]